MRFHIGFSKRISIKKIFELISFLFVLLVMLVSCDKVNAWTQIPTTGNSCPFTKYDHTYLSGNKLSVETSDVNQSMTCTSLGATSSNLSNYSTPYAFQAATSTLGNVYISKNMRYRFDFNDSMCGDPTGAKSVDFLVYINVGNSNKLNWSIFNRTGLEDSLNVRMLASDTVKKVNFSTRCSFVGYANTNGNDLNHNALYSCESVYFSNTAYNINEYSIIMENGVPYNDWIYNDPSPYAINFNGPIIWKQGNYPTGYSDASKSFQCQYSSHEPVVNGGFDVGTDPGGLNDIYDWTQDSFNPDIPGIDTSLTLLKLPKTFTDLLLLPFDVVQAVVNNSYTCTPYEIDFSSIVAKWGSPDSSYVLYLPCMRDVLSNKLGNWYTIIDMLLCFIVFYDITMHIINLINAITEGEDLFGYFFQPSHKKSSSLYDITREVRNG